MSWLIDILRSVVFWIDGIIYKLVGVVYDVFSAIATTTILSDEVLDIFSGKVYALVGIFMLFKVTFSLISYIVNPDEFVDKNKGFSKLIVNIITSLLLLVVFPFIYDEAMNIQKIVLDENIIGKIFTSSTYTLTSSVDGDFMAQETFTAFYHPNNDYNYSLNIYEIFDTDVNAKTNGDYDMYYLPVVSTIVGIILVLVLISFCFDIAVRSIKLDFLNMFAPIPIIARIDPKKGNETFNHWMKMFTSTYLDLFGRLIAIYFAIFIIGQIPNMNISSTDGSEVGLFVKVFIIMGVLLFAKQLPKLVEDLLGIKLAGNFQLNPLKKLEQVPLVGMPSANVARFAGRTAKTVGGLAAGGIGYLGGKAADGIDNFTGNRISGAKTAVKDWTNDLRTKVSTRTNTFLSRHPDLKAAKNQIDNSLNDIRNDAFSTVNTALGGVPGLGGMLTQKARQLDARIKEYDQITTNIDDMLKRANGEMIKYEDIAFEDSNHGNITMRDFKISKERLNTMRQMDTSNMSAAELNSHLAALNDLQTYIGKTEKLAEQAYINEVNNPSKYTGSRQIIDATITAKLENVQQIVSTSADSVVRNIDAKTGAGLKAGKDSVMDEKVKLQNSSEYIVAKEREQSVPKPKH